MILLLLSLASAADLAAVDVAIAARDYDEAAAAVTAILDDPAAAEDHPAAWLRMGDLLYEHELPYAALLAWTETVREDLPEAAPRLDRILDVAEEVGDELVVSPHLTDPSPLKGPIRTRAAVFGARHLVRQDDMDGVLALLRGVTPDDPSYAAAQHLRGIALSNQGQAGDALAALLTAQAAATDPERHAVITLDLGRAYYAGDNFLKAIEHMGSVPRESTLWQEAQFERAWAHFAIDDHAGAYGVLMALDSPFFWDWYWAEADLLRAYALSQMCKFPAAREAIETFEARYTPMRAEIAASVDTMDARAAWSDVIGWQNGAPTVLPAAVYQRFRFEDRFQDARAAVAEADRELQQIAKRQGWATRAMPLLTARRDTVVTTEGARVLAAARRARTEIDAVLGDLPIVKLDMMELEAEIYSRAAATGELELGDRIGKLREVRARRGERAWPFDGEYWADEVGYYRLDVRSDCPEDQP